MTPELTTTTPRPPQTPASDFKIQRIQHNPASICQYRIDSPCKERTTLKKRINMWWVFDYPATSHWAVCPFFYFDRVLRTNPVCLSGLFPNLHLPTYRLCAV